ncbi:adenosylcobinamide-phosphate synthase CbiB [Prochlorococcus sp. MIT 1341]|uniref:adenosylcobinamide-phosphate synthase CbiB n=1 Tax=Prochlorococcus sp. MIT 1341 TaxID=3096221 RepID=UPI002A74A671|nr:adenosylcobinamide-phosphate synthase CbiB [Prochlorococcus sp. MIT 1341]
MVEITEKSLLILIPTAVLLDLWVGDPTWSPHPVVIMGSLIKVLQEYVEKFSEDKKHLLRFGGLLLTTTLILFSGISGWLIERLALPGSIIPIYLGQILVLVGLSSGLAARSLYEGVIAVLKKIPELDEISDLNPARERLGKIVGRDVSGLNKEDILRATAETASENAVDGIFAPLFWMFIGLYSWHISLELPGPLSFVWIYKAVSTIDSMVGYRRGKLLWLGTAGARLEDIMTWLPCRIVVITLPIVSKPLRKYFYVIKKSIKEGSKDLSPNSGLSEAIFAYCADVRMGGQNRYKGNYIEKPLLAKNSPQAGIRSIKKILRMIFHLEITWLAIYFLSLTCMP